MAPIAILSTMYSLLTWSQLRNASRKMMPNSPTTWSAQWPKFRDSLWEKTKARDEGTPVGKEGFAGLPICRVCQVRRALDRRVCRFFGFTGHWFSRFTRFRGSQFAKHRFVAERFVGLLTSSLGLLANLVVNPWNQHFPKMHVQNCVNGVRNHKKINWTSKLGQSTI